MFWLTNMWKSCILVRPHISRRCHLIGAKRLAHRSVEDYFNCSGLVVGSLTESFVNNSLRMNEPVIPINLVKARQQHQYQIEQLNKIVNGNIVQVPLDEQYPDSVFVNDSAFVIDGKVLITQMKPQTRAGEVGPMRETIEKHANQLGIKEIVQMKIPGAHLDSGDILFTGREFLIGLSERTNTSGIEEFSQFFPSWSVTGIKVSRGVLHLTSLCSICGIDTIAIGGSPQGQEVWKEIEKLAQHSYKRVVFPDNNGANCQFINGVICHPPRDEYPESFKVWETFDTPRISLPNSELAKADGSLTCNSLSIR